MIMWVRGLVVSIVWDANRATSIPTLGYRLRMLTLGKSTTSVP